MSSCYFSLMISVHERDGGLLSPTTVFLLVLLPVIITVHLKANLKSTCLPPSWPPSASVSFYQRIWHYINFYLYCIVLSAGATEAASWHGQWETSEKTTGDFVTSLAQEHRWEHDRTSRHVYRQRQPLATHLYNLYNLFPCSGLPAPSPPLFQ